MKTRSFDVVVRVNAPKNITKKKSRELIQTMLYLGAGALEDEAIKSIGKMDEVDRNIIQDSKIVDDMLYRVKK